MISTTSRTIASPTENLLAELVEQFLDRVQSGE
jgi:hypothetical protein